MSQQNGTDNQIIAATAFTRATAPERKPLLRISPLTISLGSLLIVLLATVSFMFGARAVRFEVTPANAEVAITGGFSHQLGGRYLMLPGQYKAALTADGFEPLTQSFEVVDDPDQTLSISLTPLPGILTIQTRPEVAAMVLVDQIEVGTTPLKIDSVPAGLHDVRIIPERYFQIDTDIDISGQRIEQTLTADLMPAWAEISLATMPADATITIDDEAVGTTPVTFEALDGERRLKVSKFGYKSVESILRVEAGVSQQLPDLILEKADGSLSLTTTPAGASITVDGRYLGLTPLDVKLPPTNDVSLTLSKAGFNTVNRSLQIRPEEDATIHADLKPVLGRIELSVTPSDAILYINDTQHGPANGALSLTAREHALSIRLPGYAPFDMVVTPKPGLTQQLLVELQTEEAARIAAIAPLYTSQGGPEMKLILPGELKMGAGRREPGRRSNEIEKQVLLTRAFYLGTKEIDNATFKRYDSTHDSGILGRSRLSQDDRPVVNVSWLEAARFCNWLSEQDGLTTVYKFTSIGAEIEQPLGNGYRLPTEAEWAYAARYADGEPTRFPWGDNMPPSDIHANYADLSADRMVPYIIADYNDTYRGPAPVASFDPNDHGIYDLAGNVSEWIHDNYSIAIPRETLTDPIGPDGSSHRVIRGSNYTHGRFSELRWTYRDFGQEPRPDVGFRVARYVNNVSSEQSEDTSTVAVAEVGVVP